VKQHMKGDRDAWVNLALSHGVLMTTFELLEFDLSALDAYRPSKFACLSNSGTAARTSAKVP
jgi:hypothetical protein